MGKALLAFNKLTGVVVLILSAYHSAFAVGMSDEVHFLGELVNAPCTVAIRSQHQVVIMGQITTHALGMTGQWADPTSFQIYLEDCDPTVRDTASIAFSGTPDSHDPQVFKTGYGREAAVNVGIGIFDSKGNLLVPDSAPMAYTPLNDGETILYYTAKYRATNREIKPGDASAIVNFSVLYQ